MLWTDCFRVTGAAKKRDASVAGPGRPLSPQGAPPAPQPPAGPHPAPRNRTPPAANGRPVNTLGESDEPSISSCREHARSPNCGRGKSWGGELSFGRVVGFLMRWRNAHRFRELEDSTWFYGSVRWGVVCFFHGCRLIGLSVRLFSIGWNWMIVSGFFLVCVYSSEVIILFLKLILDLFYWIDFDLKYFYDWIE